MRETAPITIIGASLSGASLALALGRAGIDVILIDKASFPRRKACGEGLSSIGLASLDRLGLREQVLALVHGEYSGYCLWTERGPVEINWRSNGQIKGIGVQRYLLDHLLVSAALETGHVEAFFNSPVRELACNSNGCCVELGGQSITSAYLVLACGGNSPLTRKLGISSKHGPNDRFSYSLILGNQQARLPQRVNIILKNGYEVYCTPLGDGRLNVSMLGTKAAISAAKQAEALAQVVDEVKSRLNYSGDEVERPLGMGPFGARSEKVFAERVLLVGDCCEALDPIGGMGMSHALLCSSLAADALIDVLNRKMSADEEFSRYAQRREQAVRPIRGFTRMTYYLLKQWASTPLGLWLSRSPLPAMLANAVLLSKDERTLGAALGRTFLSGIGAF